MPLTSNRKYSRVWRWLALLAVTFSLATTSVGCRADVESPSPDDVASKATSLDAEYGAIGKTDVAEKAQSKLPQPPALGSDAEAPSYDGGLSRGTPDEGPAYLGEFGVGAPPFTSGSPSVTYDGSDYWAGVQRGMPHTEWGYVQPYIRSDGTFVSGHMRRTR